MMEDDAFRRKRPDFGRLTAFGFRKDGDEYHYAETFMDGAFRAELRLAPGEPPQGRVIETDTGEEFLPLRAAGHLGAFVGAVRDQYRAILDKIAAACCIDQPFGQAQAGRIAELVFQRYGERPDFPFAGPHAHSGVFRHPAGRKWYAIVMRIAREKLPPKPPDCGPSGLEALAPDAAIEIINLKADPTAIARLVREPGVFPGYHMNRKHWLSVVLEDILPDERVMALLAASRAATASGGARPPDASGKKYWLVPAHPDIYDVAAGFAREGTLFWKQRAAVRPGDVIYLYMAAPVSAILFKCEALETDLPPGVADEPATVKKVMRLCLIRQYDADFFPLARMRQCGAGPVRGARSAPPALVEALERAAG